MSGPAEIPEASEVSAAECEVLRLPLAGGDWGWGRFFAGAEKGPAVLVLHGIQSHGGWFLKSCEFLRNQGFSVLLPDRRGCGLNRHQPRGHSHSAAELIADMKEWMEWLQQKCQVERADIAAISWSGKLALVYAEQYPRQVGTLALVAPGLCAKVDITLREKIAVGVSGAIHPEKRYPIPLDRAELFTANPAMRRYIEGDPLKLLEASAGFLIASRRLDGMVRTVVQNLTRPTVLFLAERDLIIDNEATVELLRPVLGAGRERIRFYPGAHHTLDFEPEPEVFFADLAEALQQRES